MRAPAVHHAPAPCWNCGEPRPRTAAPESSAFRCFHCGAVNDPAEPQKAQGGQGARPADRIVPRQLLDTQHAALTRSRLPLAAAFLFVVLLAFVTNYAAVHFVGLNDTMTVLALGMLPLLSLLPCALISTWLMRRERVRFERLFAAIPAHGDATRLRCHGCGTALRGGSAGIERCGQCRSDNMTAANVVRRAGKTDADLSRDGQELFASEATYQYEAMMAARARSKVVLLGVPTAAALAFASVAYAQDWKTSLEVLPQTIVITAAPCSKVADLGGHMINDGVMLVPLSTSGTVTGYKRVPLAFPGLISPKDLVGQLASVAGQPPAPIRDVFRSLRSAEPFVRLEASGEPIDRPLRGTCVHVAEPYRDEAGHTATERAKLEKARENTASELKRKVMQGQVGIESVPPATRGTKP